MTWEELSTLPPLRDASGTIVLEEADDDTRTATFRIYGRRSLTATFTPAGEVRFAGEAPPILRAALVKGPDPFISPQQSAGRGKWVAAGAAAVGIAALAARRRR
jgi:MYXO-CTERM domain-containing protein